MYREIRKSDGRDRNLRDIGIFNRKKEEKRKEKGTRTDDTF